MLAPRSVSDVLRSCAAPLGVPVAYLEFPRVASVVREQDDDYVVRTFTRGAVALVSLPDPGVSGVSPDEGELEELIALTRTEASPGFVVTVSGMSLEIDSDPASVLVADEGTIDRTTPHARAAIVYDPRPMALDMLRHDAPAADWSLGGGDLPFSHRVGALAGGVLVALASAEPPRDHITRLRVVVAPGQRRRGLGRLVLETLATNIVKRGAIPYVRVAHGDAGGRALADRVGFVPFARALTFRLSTVPETESAISM